MKIDLTMTKTDLSIIRDMLDEAIPMIRDFGEVEDKFEVTTPQSNTQLIFYVVCEDCKGTGKVPELVQANWPSIPGLITAEMPLMVPCRRCQKQHED